MRAHQLVGVRNCLGCLVADDYHCVSQMPFGLGDAKEESE